MVKRLALRRSLNIAALTEKREWRRMLRVEVMIVFEARKNDRTMTAGNHIVV
jgi:hypothetical protein